MRAACIFFLVLHITGNVYNSSAELVSYQAEHGSLPSPAMQQQPPRLDKLMVF